MEYDPTDHGRQTTLTPSMLRLSIKPGEARLGQRTFSSLVQTSARRTKPGATSESVVKRLRLRDNNPWA